VTRYVRRAAIAAALIVTPLVTAAMFASASATTVTASATPLVASADQVAVPANQVTIADVKYTKKKKKKKKATAPAAKPTTPAPKPVTEAGSEVFATIEAQVITLTNQQRAANGCAALRTDVRLTAAARAHSTDMVTKNFFSHTGSNGSDFVAREKAAGYTAASAENIAWGQRTADAVMTAWMNSAGHRANILNCGSVAVGVGVAKKADGTVYWTQDFGRA
jgi:uncharacterized protein YkwD